MTAPRETGLAPGDAAPDHPRIAEDLAERGYAIVPKFLSGEAGLSLVADIEPLWRDGAYRVAGVGRGGERQVRSEIRSDRVRWLDPAEPTPAQREYWERMESLRVALNRELFLGLFDLEAHFACFPPGAFYQAHLDRHRESEARVLSAIVYLNPGWTPADGGALHLYTDRGAGVEGPFLKIDPEFGKLVLFLSADFWHEVLPARRERHSITGWFRRAT